MIERFTAQQAREASTSVAHDYDGVIRDIKEYALKGKTSIYFYKLFDKATVDQLMYGGFTVEMSNCQNDGELTTIEW